MSAPSPANRRPRAAPPSRPPRPGPGAAPRGEKRPAKPAPTLQTTTLWDYPSREYGDGRQGANAFAGSTPAYVIWNLVSRYTKPGALVVDPMAGSGTALDVARDLDRRALGYDLKPTRPDIFRADARKNPLEDGKADLVFLDPPYSTHLAYSDDPRCLGKLAAGTPAYFAALADVAREVGRILRPDRHAGVYVCDSFVKDRGFFPLGFDWFSAFRAVLEPVDIVAVTRRNRTLEQGNYRRAADEGGFFLRGFNYLLLFRKPAKKSR